VPLNFPAVEAFRYQVICLWRRALSRRSQKAHVTWKRMPRLVRGWLPRARIVHPWPDQRLRLLT
jgi:RNA-directed DNA polymerase